jgi:hypothetical protein
MLSFVLKDHCTVLSACKMNSPPSWFVARTVAGAYIDATFLSVNRNVELNLSVTILQSQQYFQSAGQH